VTTVAFSRAHFPVRSLGYGRRVGLWLQGCSIHCPGCIVPESWEAQAEHVVPVGDILSSLEPWLAECDGVTISGGEPFDQPNALEALLRGLRTAIDGDILVFSGYGEGRLTARFPHLVQLPDAIVTGPFQADLPDERPFIGSSNQKIVLNTALGRQRYADLRPYSRGLDFDVREGEIVFAGVPRRGDWAAFAGALNAAGVVATTTHAAI